MKVYLVGGAVRDELLGLPVTERDYVVVGASPEEMLAQGFKPVGKFFPVFLHPETKEEYALARTERKVAGGYHGFTFDTSTKVTLEEDLKRRDLTINAIAKTDDGELVDPYNGQADLKNKILRHVSPAFAEDPVRVLRIARFAARFAPLGFKVAPETFALMQQMAQKGELDFLVSERVFKETAKALSETAPVEFIKVLKQSGALKVLFPEIDNLYGVPQNIEHHPEKDTGIHVELVLEQATKLSPDPKVRFAALLHDLGKGLTNKEDWPKHPDHEIKGDELAKNICQRLRVPSDYEALARIVVKYHGLCHNALKLTPAEIIDLFEKCDAFRRGQRFHDFLTACEADFRGRPGYENEKYSQAAHLQKAYENCQKINIKGILSQYYQGEGEAIKAAIHQARIAALEALKN